jgi:putative ABC transport system ATP-binding protein
MVEPVIALHEVSHSFGEGALRQQILFEASAEIRAGEIVILTGPSGSGKTTLLTLAGALRSAQEGSVRTMGTELRGASPAALAQVRLHIGFIFQAHNLLRALTARQNVQASLAIDRAVSVAEAKRRAAEMLAAVGLEDHVDKRPDQLSGGQKQRVAIARALVRRPQVILADEPTAALDRTSGREVVDLLHDLAKRQGAAILLVTHDHRILDVADRVLALQDGRVVMADRRSGVGDGPH